MTTENKKAFIEMTELLMNKLNVTRERATEMALNLMSGMLDSLNNGVLADHKLS